MNRAVAWSVRGVGRETRDAAQEAARRAGMSLGEWLDEVIADQAAEQGVDPEDFDQDARLDAIGDRLSRLGRRDEPAPERFRRDRDRDQDRDRSRDRDRDEPRRRPRAPMVDDTPRAEELLDAAINKFENRAAESDARTARAFDSVATWIERSQDGRRDERETLEAVVDRLESLEERIAKQQAAAAARAAAPPAPIKNEGARDLDERMNELARRIEASEKTRREPPRPARPRIDLNDAVSQIVRRRQELDARTTNGEPEAPKRVWRNFGVDASPASPAAAPQAMLQTAPAPAAREAFVAKEAPQDNPAGGLQIEIRKLSQRLDELRREQAEKREAPVANIDALRAELAAMARSLADLAPRNAVIALEGAIRDLTQRVAAFRESGARENLLAPVDGLVAELRESLRAHDPREAVEGLRREIGAIDVKVASIAQTRIDPLVFERIRQQTEEARNHLAALAQRPAPLDRLEKQIGDLADRVDRLATSAAPRAESAQVVASLADARAQLERSTPTAALTSIERRLEQIASKMDQALQRPLPAPIVNPRALEELSKRIDGMRESMETRGAAAASPAFRVDNSALEQSLREISAKLDRPPATALDAGAIEAMIQDLGARIDRRTNPVIDTAPLEQVLRKLGERPVSLDMQPIEGLMREISAKLDKPVSASVDAAALETMIQDLGARLDRQVNPVIDTAPFEQVLRKLGERPVGPDTQPLEGLMREISAKLDKPVTASVDAAALESMIQDLGARIDRQVSPIIDTAPFEQVLRRLGERPVALDMRPLEGLMREISAKLDRSPTAPVDAAGLENLIHDLGARIDRQTNPVIDTRPLEQTLRQLHDKMDRSALSTQAAERIDHAVQFFSEQMASKSESGSDIATLETLIRGLERKFENAQSDGHDSRALEALHAEIADLKYRLDASQSVSSTSALEHMVAELLAQLDQTRQALRNVAGPTSEMAPGRDAFTLGLADLRAEHTNSDRRVQSTLSRVQSVLETLVDRMGQIEEEVVGGKPVSTPPTARPAAAVGGVEDAPARASAALNSMDSTIRETPVFAPARALAEARGDSRSSPPASSGAMRSIDGADFLIEPGAGAPMRALEKDSIAGGEPKNVVNAHIAAARRAAQAALVESANQIGKDGAKPAKNPAAPSSSVSGIEQARAFFVARRRPILLGVALFALVTIAVVELGVLRQPNAQRSDIDLAAPAHLAAADPSLQGGVAGSPPKSDARVDSTPVGSINPILSGAAPAKAPTPAPADLVASIPGVAPQTLRDAAAAGDPTAQFELALRLADGRNMPRDPHAAAQWFERAAAQDLAPAQYRLGSFYEKGIGVTRDVPLAKAWYKKAAEAGNARAMHNLAVLIAEGAGIKPDYSEAADWFQRAAQLGVKDSQYNLGVLYARGMGIGQDLGQSWVWFSLAAQQGDVDAAKKRDEVAAKMDAKTLDAAGTALANFHAATPNPAANDVATPPGGWDGGKTSAAPAPAPKPQAASQPPHARSASTATSM